MSRKKFLPRPDAEKIFVSRSSPLPVSVPVNFGSFLLRARLPGLPWISFSAVGLGAGPGIFVLRDQTTSCTLSGNLSGWIRMSNRVLIYTFPFFLALMEWLLRTSLRVESKEFVGPTIAAAALGLLLPLTGLKNHEFALSDSTRRQVDALKAVIVPKRERILVDIVWIVILGSLATWGACLVFACKPDSNPLHVSPIYYALGTYFLAVIFSEIREAL
jgi:hypothetical protein